MQETNCSKCIHFNVCEFCNNKITKEDWDFINKNFMITCKHYKNKNAVNVISASIIELDNKNIDFDKIAATISKKLKASLIES